MSDFARRTIAAGVGAIALCGVGVAAAPAADFYAEPGVPQAPPQYVERDVYAPPLPQRYVVRPPAPVYGYPPAPVYGYPPYPPAPVYGYPPLVAPYGYGPPPVAVVPGPYPYYRYRYARGYRPYGHFGYPGFYR